MKRILIVSTVSRQFYLFEQGNIEVLKYLGFEIHGAADFADANERLDALDIIRHPIDIQRTPYSAKNIKAYRQLKELMREGNFDAVHCHSPMGGVLARLAARATHLSPVIYTAHGFHFYKGAPKINWILYYAVEKYLSKFTDVLITINEEDYERAKKFKAKRVFYIPGIGVDCEKFAPIEKIRIEKRRELGLSDDTIVLLSIGELIKRKNHETALNAIAKLKNRNFNYLICGKGELENRLKELSVKLGIDKNVRFLGFRNDIPEICIAADVFVFPSYQEGLPVSVMEAMSAGLPVVCSSIRGNTDLIENGKGGFLHPAEDISGFTKSIDILIENHEVRKRMGRVNLENVRNYDKKVVKQKMMSIYGEL